MECIFYPLPYVATAVFIAVQQKNKKCSKLPFVCQVRYLFINTLVDNFNLRFKRSEVGK